MIHFYCKRNKLFYKFLNVYLLNVFETLQYLKQKFTPYIQTSCILLEIENIFPFVTMKTSF